MCRMLVSQEQPQIRQEILVKNR